MNKQITLFFLFVCLFPSCKHHKDSVQILYYGHSCFELNYGNLRILIDPFTPEWFDYISPDGSFDFVFSSHDAKDHNYFEGLTISRLIRASGASDEFTISTNDTSWIQTGKMIVNSDNKQFTFWTVPSFHDEFQGQINGVNGIMCFDFNGIRIVHMGDIGQFLEEGQIENIQRIDILMIPVDSYYIIDLVKAREIVTQLSPSIIIPMHYKTVKSRNNAKAEDLILFSKMFDKVDEFEGTIFNVTDKVIKGESCLLILDYLRDH